MPLSAQDYACQVRVLVLPTPPPVSDCPGQNTGKHGACMARNVIFCYDTSNCSQVLLLKCAI